MNINTDNAPENMYTDKMLDKLSIVANTINTDVFDNLYLMNNVLRKNKIKSACMKDNNHVVADFMLDDNHYIKTIEQYDLYSKKLLFKDNISINNFGGIENTSKFICDVCIENCYNTFDENNNVILTKSYFKNKLVHIAHFVYDDHQNIIEDLKLFSNNEDVELPEALLDYMNARQAVSSKYIFMPFVEYSMITSTYNNGLLVSTVSEMRNSHINEIYSYDDDNMLIEITNDMGEAIKYNHLSNGLTTILAKRKSHLQNSMFEYEEIDEKLLTSKDGNKVIHRTTHIEDAVTQEVFIDENNNILLDRHIDNCGNPEVCQIIYNGSNIKQKIIKSRDLITFKIVYSENGLIDTIEIYDMYFNNKMAMFNIVYNS